MRTIKKTVHVVGAIIKNDNGEILCALRGPDMTLANYWEFPGGKIEKGESKSEALQREVLEELGCEIDVLKQVEDTTYEYDAVIVRLETFYSRIKSGTPKSFEHAELRWVPVNQLAALNWAPADIPAVKKVSDHAKEKSNS